MDPSPGHLSESHLFFDHHKLVDIYDQYNNYFKYGVK